MDEDEKALRHQGGPQGKTSIVDEAHFSDLGFARSRTSYTQGPFIGSG